MAPLLFIASNHKRNFLISSPASYVASNFISWSLSCIVLGNDREHISKPSLTSRSDQPNMDD
ncbi:alternative cyclin pcl12 [Moniliophthora roreri]|nr:alternative cyclin pcl12 [Moniliophthora roreri]